jgi:serine protease inhibitor
MHATVTTQRRLAHFSYIAIPCLVILTTALFACRKSTPAPDITRNLDLPAGSAQIISAGNQFAMNFFNTVLQHDTVTPNPLISPLSIYMALSMLYNGSEGATRDSIALVLQQTGLPIDQLNAVSNALIHQLPTEDSKISLSVANSLWYQKNGPQPLANYLDTLGEEYSGHLQALDFSNPSSLNTINNWVATKTDNKITSILNSLSPADIMVLVNAVYFNGPWHFHINPSWTSNQLFYLSDGSTKNVPTMGMETTLRIYKDPAYTLIELPYGAGNSFAMYVALPTDQQQPIANFASSFTSSSLSAALPRLDSQYAGVLLPKWELSYSIPDMIPNLTALGMGIAATGSADFSGMFTTKTQLSQAIHKTFIDVSEQGTEAAAATGVVSIASVPNIPAYPINHPFLYFIVEKQTGAILFMGTMNDPSLNN